MRGAIFTLIFFDVTIFWETAHTGSAMFVNTQLILVFLIGFLETLNIFIQSKKQNTESPLGPAVSLEFVIIALVITPSYHNLHARMGAIFMALNSCVHYG